MSRAVAVVLGLFFSVALGGLHAQPSSPPGPLLFIASWNSGVGESGAGFPGSRGQTCVGSVREPYPTPLVTLVPATVEGGRCQQVGDRLQSNVGLSATGFGAIGSSQSTGDSGNLETIANASFHNDDLGQVANVLSGVASYQENLPAPVPPGSSMTLRFEVSAAVPLHGIASVFYAMVSTSGGLNPVVVHSVQQSIEFSGSTTQSITTAPLTVGASGTYALLLSLGASAAAPGVTSIRIGRGDSVTPQFSTGLDPIGIWVNGQADGVQWDHRTLVSSDIDPTIFLGTNVTRSQSANGNEVVAFSKRRPVALLENAPWTDTVDDLQEPQFRPEITLPIKFWVVSGNVANRRTDANRMVAWANHVWRQERVGLQLGQVQIEDATANANANLVKDINLLFAGLPELLIGKAAGMINVYMINTIRTNSGTTVGLTPHSSITSNELPDVVLLAEQGSLDTLVHEIGHSLGLEHACEAPCANPGRFDSSNVMWYVTNDFYGWRPQAVMSNLAQIVALTPSGQLNLFQAENSGAGVTGVSEPVWPEALNAEVVDGTLKWINKGAPSAFVAVPSEFLTEGQIFRAIVGNGSSVNRVYHKRPGEPTRDCGRNDESLNCPAYDKRIWDDGNHKAN